MSTDKGIGTEPLNFYQRDEDFWDKYIKGRPKLSDEFFNRIFEYHASHGGHFDVAHDLGAGPGVWSPSLAKRFKQVIVSDVSESNVHQAEARLGSHGYSFKVASVNDPPGNVPDSTVDLVFAGTMMHFAESDKAIPNIVAQLKSGGTFAVYCPGRPMIDDMSVEKTFKDALHDGARAIWRHAKDQNERLHSLWRIAHGYDSMPLPEEFFLEGAKRITLNAESMDDFIPPEMDAEGTKLFGHEHGEYKPSETAPRRAWGVGEDPGLDMNSGLTQCLDSRHTI